MKQLSALIILLVVALTSCDKIVSASDVPYEDLIVVRGILRAGEPVDSLEFSHTIPFSEAYSPQNAAISGVVGTISVDGVDHALAGSLRGYYSCPGLIAERGRTYTLRASWNGKQIEATTTVPPYASIDSFQLGHLRTDTTYIDTIQAFRYAVSIRAFVHAPKGSMLALTYESALPGDTNYQKGINYFLTEDTLMDGDMRLYSFASRIHIPGKTLPEDSASYRAVVLNVDPQYNQYLLTSDRNNSDHLFSTGGSNPVWNVTGDGFGLFVSLAKTTRTFTF